MNITSLIAGVAAGCSVGALEQEDMHMVGMIALPALGLLGGHIYAYFQRSRQTAPESNDESDSSAIQQSPNNNPEPDVDMSEESDVESEEMRMM